MDSITPNKVYIEKFTFTQEDVVLFAKASGDTNPIHFDDEYAKNTVFKRRIIHGFLAGSVFSKFFGVVFPGEGSIYLSQNMKFLKPMFVETDYTAEITIREIMEEKKRIKFETNVKDSRGELTITGDAVIQNENIFKNFNQ
jgi:acyl dehydratase